MWKNGWFDTFVINAEIGNDTVIETDVSMDTIVGGDKKLKDFTNHGSPAFENFWPESGRIGKNSSTQF